MRDMSIEIATRIARSQYQTRMRPGKDHNGEVTQRLLHGSNGSSGAIDEILESHPRAEARWLEIEDGVAGAAWELTACGSRRFPETPREKLARDLLEEYIDDDSQMIFTDFNNGHGSWREFLRDRSKLLLHNFDVAEVRSVDKTMRLSNGFVVPATEVYTVPQSTVDQWDEDDATRTVRGLIQQTTRGRVLIPVERLFWAKLRGGGHEGGKPAIRSFLFWFYTIRSLVQSQSAVAQAMGGTWSAKETEPGRMDDGNVQAVFDLWEEYERSDRRFMLWPAGIEGGMQFPTGALFSIKEFYDITAGQIDELFGAFTQTIGFQKNGSRAFGEVMQDEELARWILTLETVADGIRSQLFRRLLNSWGFGDCRVPKYIVPKSEASASPTETAAMLGALTTAGMPVSSKVWRWAATSLVGIPEEVLDAAPEPTATNPDRTGPTGGSGTDRTAFAPPQPTTARPLPVPGAQLSEHAPGCRCAKHRGLSLADAGQTQTVYVLVGPPCSGKSTIAAQMSRTGRPVTNISLDNEIYDAGDGTFVYTPQSAERAHEVGREKLAAAIARGDETIVYDAVLASPATRRKMVERIRATEGANAYRIEAIVPPAADLPELLERNAARPESRRVPRHVIEATARQIANEPPTTAEGFDLVHVLKSLSLRLADGDAPRPVQVTDAAGKTFTYYRELNEYEAAVCWVDDEDVRRALDGSLRPALELIIEDHQATVFGVIGDTPVSPGQRDIDLERVRIDFEARYRDAVEAYVSRILAASAEQGARERDRQRIVDAGAAVAPVVRRSVIDYSEQEQAALDTEVREAARSIANRVQREAVRASNQRTSPSQFEAAVNINGLLREALIAGNRAETQGRINEAVEATKADPGLVVLGAIRTMVRDRRACGVCRGRDGRRYDFPADLQRFLSEPEAMTPDPECTGAPYCRCGYLMIYGAAAPA